MAVTSSFFCPRDGYCSFWCAFFFSGNYGNQLDLSVPPSSSSTSPTNAIFDGSHYYFLPWNDIKPCCNVDSHWEDIAFRLEPRNILTRICEQLVSFNISPNRCAKRSIYLRRIDVCIVIFQLGVRLGKSSAGCFWESNSNNHCCSYN